MTPPPASAASCGTRPPPESFALAGPSAALDRRVHAYRSDLADIALAGCRFAPHYARAEPGRCVAIAAMLRDAPHGDAPAVSQLVHGERFHLLDQSGGWAWGRCGHDGYVGYLPADAIGPEAPADWRVAAPLALCFAAAGIKAPVVASFPFGARLGGTVHGEFVRVEDGFIHLRHLAPIDRPEADWVAAAERLVGSPYLWAGRGAGGIDCSGLVQVALGAAGIPCPRDSDQQRDALGRPLTDGEAPMRGDLLFFPGHVGILLNAERLLHANAFWMTTLAEPLADAMARMGQPIARRRIPA